MKYMYQGIGGELTVIAVTYVMKVFFYHRLRSGKRNTETAAAGVGTQSPFLGRA